MTTLKEWEEEGRRADEEAADQSRKDAIHQARQEAAEAESNRKDADDEAYRQDLEDQHNSWGK